MIISSKIAVRVILLIGLIAFSTLFASLSPSVFAQQNGSGVFIVYYPNPVTANSTVQLSAKVVGVNPTGNITWSSNSTGFFNSTITPVISGGSNYSHL